MIWLYTAAVIVPVMSAVFFAWHGRAYPNNPIRRNAFQIAQWLRYACGVIIILNICMFIVDYAHGHVTIESVLVILAMFATLWALLQVKG